jgi:hypothetical protein
LCRKRQKADVGSSEWEISLSDDGVVRVIFQLPKSGSNRIRFSLLYLLSQFVRVVTCDITFGHYGWCAGIACFRYFYFIMTDSRPINVPFRLALTWASIFAVSFYSLRFGMSIRLAVLRWPLVCWSVAGIDCMAPSGQTLPALSSRRQLITHSLLGPIAGAFLVLKPVTMFSVFFCPPHIFRVSSVGGGFSLLSSRANYFCRIRDTNKSLTM